MSVTLVLDASATLAYARQLLSVGELLSIVNEDGDSTVVPATCLVEAAAQADGTEVDMLRLLTVLPGVDVTPLSPDLALGMGTLAKERRRRWDGPRCDRGICTRRTGSDS